MDLPLIESTDFYLESRSHQPAELNPGVCSPMVQFIWVGLKATRGIWSEPIQVKNLVDCDPLERGGLGPLARNSGADHH